MEILPTREDVANTVELIQEYISSSEKKMFYDNQANKYLVLIAEDLVKLRVLDYIDEIEGIDKNKLNEDLTLEDLGLSIKYDTIEKKGKVILLNLEEKAKNLGLRVTKKPFISQKESSVSLFCRLITSIKVFLEFEFLWRLSQDPALLPALDVLSQDYE